jgi:hypothetical protein
LTIGAPLVGKIIPAQLGIRFVMWDWQSGEYPVKSKKASDSFHRGCITANPEVSSQPATG